MAVTLEKEKVISQIWQLIQELTPSERLSLSEQLIAEVRNQLPNLNMAQTGRAKCTRLSH